MCSAEKSLCRHERVAQAPLPVLLGESAQRKLPALAARFLRTGRARWSEPIGGHVSEGNSYCFFQMLRRISGETPRTPCYTAIPRRPRALLGVARYAARRSLRPRTCTNCWRHRRVDFWSCSSSTELQSAALPSGGRPPFQESAISFAKSANWIEAFPA